MTCRTKPRRATDRPADAGATTKPICRRLFSIQQAADFAGVPVQWICSWVRTRKLEAYVLAGSLRVDEAELADFLSSPGSKRP